MRSMWDVFAAQLNALVRRLYDADCGTCMRCACDYVALHWCKAYVRMGLRRACTVAALCAHYRAAMKCTYHQAHCTGSA